MATARGDHRTYRRRDFHVVVGKQERRGMPNEYALHIQLHIDGMPAMERVFLAGVRPSARDRRIAMSWLFHKLREDIVEQSAERYAVIK